jgi:hypothetical protein
MTTHVEEHPMTDLRTLLHEASHQGVRPAAAEDVVTADLARARRGLRRRWIRRGAGTGLVAAAVAAVAVVTLQSGWLPVDSSGAAPPSAVGPAPSAPEIGPGVALVSYTGTQPVGFVVDKVPEGWEVQGADAGSLTVAPIGMADQDIHSFLGKIAVFQGQELPDDLTGTPVQVGGADALVFQMEDGLDGSKGGKTLFVLQPSGAYLQVQTPAELGWSDQQLAEFAAGVHVTGDAVSTVG